MRQILCLPLLFSSLVTAAQGQKLSSATPERLLGPDSQTFANWLETARPAPVSSEFKARVLATLPPEGEVTNLDRSARLKLVGVKEVLRAARRDEVFEIKVVDVPQAAVGFHARAVVIITKPALDLLSADELQALVAHEIGHEYIWQEFDQASRSKDRKRLKELELTCDGIAIMTLRQLGKDPSRLVTAIERVVRFNRERLGYALNEDSYPTVAERRAFAQAVLAWAAGKADTVLPITSSNVA